LTFFTFPHLALCVVLGAAIAFLDLADELVAMTRELLELVIGQLAPALLDRAFHLLPVTLDAVPVHGDP
jgi:hypothetical protein